MGLSLSGPTHLLTCTPRSEGGNSLRCGGQANKSTLSRFCKGDLKRFCSIESRGAQAPRSDTEYIYEGFDPGSERTLAAWIRHASRTNPAWVTGRGKWRKGQ